jgi:hypothetical protein
MSDSIALAIKPIVRYPRVAQVGKMYLMTIDLEVEPGAEWNYDEEEYPVYCTVESELFTTQIIGEPVIVLHRFGGSYGEAKFLLTAAAESRQGNVKVALINAWGLSIGLFRLKEIQLTDNDNSLSLINFNNAIINSNPLEEYDAGESSTDVNDLRSSLFQLVIVELQKETKASEVHCADVAERISQEVLKICAESSRIQESGDIPAWANLLTRHRLESCLHYYKLGSRRARVEIHSTLSAIIYRHISPKDQNSYETRLSLIEDFLQIFYIEALKRFRSEMAFQIDYMPRTLLQLSEYIAFTERYAKRRVFLSKCNKNLRLIDYVTFEHKSLKNRVLLLGQRKIVSCLLRPPGKQQLIILRAQTFSQQKQLREITDIQKSELFEDSLHKNVIKELIKYLREIKEDESIPYLSLRLQDLSSHEIESILDLTPTQREVLQQRFKYHLVKFIFSHRSELVHQ